MTYFPTIGLEIHAELKTRTKMFCRCLNDPQENHPNINICPICMAHPGTLPVINIEAVKSVIRTGLALDCEINKKSKFDRKNYFYPDLPKGYQISQYDEPLCLTGKLSLYLSDKPELNSRFINIKRIHLEEDTGRLIHASDKSSTLVDFNRAGVPLMELVTEPDIHSAEEAKLFSQGLQLLLRYLDVSKADMEKGQMRVEVNISLSKGTEFGTKVEIKNLNSFRSVEKAIEFEIQRQTDLIESGEKILQETRGWNDEKGITYSQRSKEEAHDYRYFPEPDLPPILAFNTKDEQGLFDMDDLKISLPELPWDKKQRLIRLYGLEPKSSILLIADPELGDYLEKVISEAEADDVNQNEEDKKSIIQLAYNYLCSDLRGLMIEKGTGINEIRITPRALAQLVFFIHSGRISSRAAKDVLQEMFKTGRDPEELIREMGMEKISDANALTDIAIEVINNNPGPVADFKKGKINILQFLVGRCMAKSKGAGDPQIFKEILEEEIKKQS